MMRGGSPRHHLRRMIATRWFSRERLPAVKKLLPVLLVLATAVAALWWRGRGPEGFVLISIDTLRADHLGAYGYPLDTSPFFDEFAERGTLFEKAFVQLPGTLPSHMSIFTGLYPMEHGVYPPDSVLSEEISTLPEMFQRAGYRTAAFSEGGYVAGRYGFSRGFDVYDDIGKSKPGGAAETVRRALEFVDSLKGDDRFFIFLHTYEVHDPYMAPEGYGSWPGPPPDIWQPSGANLTAASKGELSFDSEDLEYFVSLYDASLRFVDDQLRRFVEHLWDRGVSRDSWVVITSDHGEEFFEHGSLVHRQVYAETLHVPLLIRRLGQRRGTRVRSLVESVDIAPTLFELADLEDPAASFSGRSLVSALKNPAEVIRSQAYAENLTSPTRTLLESREDGLFQLLVTRFPDSERRELFDLSRDPAALRDLSGTRRALARDLEIKLEAYDWQARAEARREDLGEEQIERLRALGYLQ